MDDKLLSEQLKKTGNLMDLLNDETFVREAAAIEAECGGVVEAGLELKSYVAQIEAASPESLKRQRQAVKVLSILLPELRQWMEDWQLGLCFESVYTEAQRIIYERLDDFMVEEQDWISDLLSECEKGLPVGNRPIRGEAISKLSMLLTQEGGRALADIAAQDMADNVFKAFQTKSLLSVTA